MKTFMTQFSFKELHFQLGLLRHCKSSVQPNYVLYVHKLSIHYVHHWHCKWDCKNALAISKISKIVLILQFVDTAMGVDMKALQNGSSDYVEAVYQVKEAVAVRQRTPWYWPPWIYNMLPVGREVNRNTKLMHDFAYKVCGNDFK